MAHSYAPPVQNTTGPISLSQPTTGVGLWLNNGVLTFWDGTQNNILDFNEGSQTSLFDTEIQGDI